MCADHFLRFLRWLLLDLNIRLNVTDYILLYVPVLYWWIYWWIYRWIYWWIYWWIYQGGERFSAKNAFEEVKEQWPIDHAIRPVLCDRREVKQSPSFLKRRLFYRSKKRKNEKTMNSDSYLISIAERLKKTLSNCCVNIRIPYRTLFERTLIGR